MGVEPIGDGITRHPPVLKTVRFTGIHSLPCLYFNNLQRYRCYLLLDCYLIYNR